jgi:hypothetical protein
VCSQSNTNQQNRIKKKGEEGPAKMQPPSIEWLVSSMKDWQVYRDKLTVVEENCFSLDPSSFPPVAISTTTRPLLVLSIGYEKGEKRIEGQKEEEKLMWEVFGCCQKAFNLPAQLAQCSVSFQKKVHVDADAEYEEEDGIGILSLSNPVFQGSPFFLPPLRFPSN